MATFMDSGTGYSNLALKIEIIVLHKKLQFFVVFVLVDNRTFAGGGRGELFSEDLSFLAAFIASEEI